MLFAVTHFDRNGHRRKARVAARDNRSAMEQMEAMFGPARAVHCLRLAARPVLRLVAGQMGGRDAAHA